MPGTNPTAIERALFARGTLEERVTVLEVTVGALDSLTVITEAFSNVTGTVAVAHTPFSSWTPIAFKNGIIQVPTTDWTRSGATFTFTPALAGDDVQISYAYTT